MNKTEKDLNTIWEDYKKEIDITTRTGQNISFNQIVEDRNLEYAKELATEFCAGFQTAINLAQNYFKQKTIVRKINKVESKN